MRVDFNHPLAGKELLYDIKVERELTEPKEQIEELYKKYFGMVPEKEKGISIEKGSVEVTLSPRWSANLGPSDRSHRRRGVKGQHKLPGAWSGLLLPVTTTLEQMLHIRRNIQLHAESWRGVLVLAQ